MVLYNKKELNILSKSYCLNCSKEVNNNIQECKCGSRSFVYGSHFKVIDKNVICDCGSKTFNRNMHMDFTDKHIDNYSCKSCNNPIGLEVYRSPEERFLWED